MDTFYEKNKAIRILRPHNFPSTDIALIKLEEPLDLNSKTIAAARMPPKDSELPSGSKVTLVGWGITGIVYGRKERPDRLQIFTAPIIDAE